MVPTCSPSITVNTLDGVVHAYTVRKFTPFVSDIICDVSLGHNGLETSELKGLEDTDICAQLLQLHPAIICGDL